jgi:hypothetical protein
MLRCIRWTVLLAATALAACGGGGSSSAGSGTSSGAASSSGSVDNFAAGGANIVSMTVGTGAADFFNIPTVSVTVCIPGTTTCTTVTNVQVDTGSYGLRLMASQLNGLALQTQSDPNTAGNDIAECLAFADGYTWGPVATADVKIGGETAASMPINIIDDNSSFSPTIPSTCTSSGGGNLGAVSSFGANGLLGVGLFTYDCLDYCEYPVADQTQGYQYYTCNASTCQPASEPVSSQVVNPVAVFPRDNNGVILQLPAIAAGGAKSAVGYLVFGIGTESNNGLTDAVSVQTTSSEGFISTTFNGQALDSSFIDSGSNGLFFADSSIPTCSGSADIFYCPTETVSLSASTEGQNGAILSVPFQVANLDDLSNTSPTDFAFNDVGGPAIAINNVGSYFDFGMPFFYGRTVFVGINGKVAGAYTGPFYAY